MKKFLLIIIFIKISIIIIYFINSIYFYFKIGYDIFKLNKKRVEKCKKIDKNSKKYFKSIKKEKEFRKLL